MDTKANYAVIGLFVIVLTGLLIFGFVWLSGFSHQKKYETYLVYVSGGVTGLNVDSSVYYNGVRVGTVSKIKLDKNNSQFVKLFLKIESGIPITQATVATLISQGITGLVNVGLKSQGAVAPLLTTETGQPYPIIPFEKPLLMQISEVLPELTRNLGDIANKFKKLFDDNNLQNLSETLDHINHVTGVIDKQSNAIHSSINSLNIFLKNSANASQGFNSIVMSTQQTMDQLNKTSVQINDGVSTVRQQIMPSLEDLLIQLNDTTGNLQRLSKDLEGNPAMLIRGKQPPPPGPGE